MNTLPGLFLIAILIVGGIWCASSERKNWNKGFCSCGFRWRLFDMDSQGGRGYCCDKCNKNLWVSWSVDKNYTPIPRTDPTKLTIN